MQGLMESRILHRAKIVRYFFAAIIDDLLRFFWTNIGDIDLVTLLLYFQDLIITGNQDCLFVTHHELLSICLTSQDDHMANAVGVSCNLLIVIIA